MVGNALVLAGVAIGLSYLGMSPLSAFFWLILLAADFIFDISLISFLNWRRNERQKQYAKDHPYVPSQDYDDEGSDDDESDYDGEEEEETE